MLASNANCVPVRTFADPKSQLSKSAFTYNLSDLRYKRDGLGRDSYIYNSNGGFSIEH